MTQMPVPELDKCRSATALAPLAREVHRRILETFAATGRAPLRADLDRITRDLGAEPGPVLAQLAASDVIALDTRGEIRAAYPFSPSPSLIQVTSAGGPATYAMCAIDALGISAMLDRPVTITAAEPDSGRLVTIEVDRDQARWNPSAAVVFAGATRGACGASVDRSCGYINFFTSAEAARAWAARHPGVAGMTLSQAEALERGIAEFGALMRGR